MKNDTKNNQRNQYLDSLKETLKQYEQKIKALSSKKGGVLSGKKEESFKAADQIKKKYQQAEKIYQNLKEATENNWENVKSQASEVFHELENAFNETTDLFSWDDLQHVGEEVMDYGQEKLTQLSDCIRKKPVTSALWALSIGFVLGKMMRAK